MYKPDKSVIELIQNYNPRLTAWGNPYTTAEDEALVIGYKKPIVNAMVSVDPSNGVVLSRSVGVAMILYPETHFADTRIIYGLEEAKQARRANLAQEYKDQYNKAYEDRLNYHTDYCQGYPYWAYKKMIEEYNFALFPSRDPAREEKAWEDRHGRRKAYL